MRNQTIRTEFGRIFRRKRVAAGMSRAALSVAIGASYGAIRKWESGTRFIEDLSLIGPIEKSINAYLPDMLDEAFRAVSKRTRS